MSSVAAAQAAPPAPPRQDQIDAARRTHDTTWERVADFYVGDGRPANPPKPTPHEKKFILTVADILTRGVPGVVNIIGLPGNFPPNLVIAIMYYYQLKGWPRLQYAFLSTVYDHMLDV